MVRGRYAEGTRMVRGSPFLGSRRHCYGTRKDADGTRRVRRMLGRAILAAGKLGRAILAAEKPWAGYFGRGKTLGGVFWPRKNLGWGIFGCGNTWAGAILAAEKPRTRAPSGNLTYRLCIDT